VNQDGVDDQRIVDRGEQTHPAPAAQTRQHVEVDGPVVAASFSDVPDPVHSFARAPGALR
jgi:hypothetical protein